MAETIAETSPGAGDGGSPQSADASAGGKRSGASWTRLIAVSGAVLVVLLLGAALGMLMQRGAGAGFGAGTQSEGGSVDIGFAQDMAVHHRQAVLMAGMARDRSTDPVIQSLAFDIETSQLEQVGRMQGWLSLWNAAPLPTGRYMTWMSDSSMPGMTHGSGPGTDEVVTMPGMASPADLERLRAAGGTQFDVLFLQLMLRHHQGGVPMATYAAEDAETAQVRNLADKIVISQDAESKYMTDLITERGALPLPPPS